MSKKKEKQPWVGVIEEPLEEDEKPEIKPVSIAWPSSAPAELVVEKKQQVEEKKTAED